jgi:hypothetical protein
MGDEDRRRLPLPAGGASREVHVESLPQEDREDGLTERKCLADERDRVADERDRVSDARDATSELRDRGTDRRDALADARDERRRSTSSFGGP